MARFATLSSGSERVRGKLQAALYHNREARRESVREVDLLRDIDFGDPGGVRHYYDGAGVRDAPHNLLKDSEDFSDPGSNWTANNTTILNSTDVQFTGILAARIHQILDGGNSRYQGVVGEQYTLTCDVEVMSVDVAGDVRAVIFDAADSTITSDVAVSSPGQKFSFSVTHTCASATNIQMQFARTQNVPYFSGVLRITNRRVAIGERTFDVMTGNAGPVYTYRTGVPVYDPNSDEMTASWFNNEAVTEQFRDNQAVEFTDGLLFNGDSAGTIDAVVSTEWSIAGNTELTTNLDVNLSRGYEGGARYLDVRVNGTAAANARLWVRSQDRASDDGQTWSTAWAMRLQDETTTTAFDYASLNLIEKVTIEYVLATTGNLSLATLQSLSGQSMSSNGYWLTGTNSSGETGTQRSIWEIRCNAGAIDMTFRFWMPSFTQTNYHPQPILTYGSAVTATAENPLAVVGDWFEQYGKGTVVGVSTIQGDSTADANSVWSFSEDASSGALPSIGLWMQDTAGDGLIRFTVRSRNALGVENKNTAQTFQEGFAAATVFSWNTETEVSHFAAQNSDGDTLVDTDSTAVRLPDVGEDLLEFSPIDMPGLAVGAKPYRGWKKLVYIRGLYLNEAQCAARAAREIS